MDTWSCPFLFLLLAIHYVHVPVCACFRSSKFNKSIWITAEHANTFFYLFAWFRFSECMSLIPWDTSSTCLFVYHWHLSVLKWLTSDLHKNGSELIYVLPRIGLKGKVIDLLMGILESRWYTENTQMMMMSSCIKHSVLDGQHMAEKNSFYSPKGI